MDIEVVGERSSVARYKPSTVRGNVMLTAPVNRVLDYM